MLESYTSPFTRGNKDDKTNQIADYIKPVQLAEKY
jgi:hypothetical protein